MLTNRKLLFSGLAIAAIAVVTLSGVKAAQKVDQNAPPNLSVVDNNFDQFSATPNEDAQQALAPNANADNNLADAQKVIISANDATTTKATTGDTSGAANSAVLQ